FSSSRRRHTSFSRDWSSDVRSSDLTRARALDPHFQILQTIILGRVARVLCSNLRSKRGAFTRTAETGTTGGRPGQYIALTIRDEIGRASWRERGELCDGGVPSM